MKNIQLLDLENYKLTTSGNLYRVQFSFKICTRLIYNTDMYSGDECEFTRNDNCKCAFNRDFIYNLVPLLYLFFVACIFSVIGTMVVYEVYNMNKISVTPQENVLNILCTAKTVINELI